MNLLFKVVLVHAREDTSFHVLVHHSESDLLEMRGAFLVNIRILKGGKKKPCIGLPNRHGVRIGALHVDV